MSQKIIRNYNKDYKVLKTRFNYKKIRTNYLRIQINKKKKIKI